MNKRLKIASIGVIVAISLYSFTALKVRNNYIETDKLAVGHIIDSFAENTKEGGHNISGLYSALGPALTSNSNISTSVNTINSNNSNYVKITVKVKKTSILPLMGYSYEVDKTQTISK